VGTILVWSAAVALLRRFGFSFALLFWAAPRSQTGETKAAEQSTAALHTKTQTATPACRENMGRGTVSML
jgi:hypothetical protein